MKHPVDNWLTINDVRKADLAARVGISPVHLNRLLRADPSTSYTTDLFERLSDAMNGDLTAEELFAEFQRRRRLQAEAAERDPAAA